MRKKILPATTTPPRKAKLVVFAFKQYGLGLLPSFYTPFLDKYHENPHVELIEICFVEHKFLSLLKGMFISGLKRKISSDRHANTGYVFGGVMDIAERMNLPNVFTGYAFLLDTDNKIRWQRCGEAEEGDILSLHVCVDTLLMGNKAKLATQK